MELLLTWQTRVPKTETRAENALIDLPQSMHLLLVSKVISLYPHNLDSIFLCFPQRPKRELHPATNQTPDNSLIFAERNNNFRGIQELMYPIKTGEVIFNIYGWQNPKFVQHHQIFIYGLKLESHLQEYTNRRTCFLIWNVQTE